jgi:hypothetical protein
MRHLIASITLSVITSSAAIAACPPFSLLDRALPPAVDETPYTATLPALGGSGTISFLLTEGLLPPGLRLDAAGRFHGTPLSPGAYRFTVFATDSCTPARQQASRSYLLTVARPGETPAVSSARTLPPLKVRAESLTPALSVPASRPFVTLHYRLTATPSATAIIESPGHSFIVDGEVAASVANPLQATLINGVTELSEEVTIPLAAVRSATNGSGKIVINRIFSGRGTSVAVVIDVQLKR